MLNAIRIHWFIVRVGIGERLVYRGDFAFATCVRFLPLVTQIFLWGAIYGSTTERSINGYTESDMIAYFLLVMVARAFSSMPGLASGIARDVRDGAIKKYLTQPIDMLSFLFSHRVAHKLVYYFVAAGPFAVVFWIMRDALPGWPEPPVLAAFLLSLVFAFLIGFLLESLIGLISFWFLEVSSLLFIYMMVNFFLSGHMIPLDYLPAPLSDWCRYLPFNYLAYFPAAVLLGRIPLAELPRELMIELLWILSLFAMNRIALARGVRRYGAFGG